MSRIKNAFKNKKAFIGFLTAGDPNAAKTIEYIKVMIESGADLIEIGIPFSDPVAEGADNRGCQSPRPECGDDYQGRI